MMKNLNNNLIVSTLGILVAFGLAFVAFPASAHAEYAYYHFSNNDNQNMKLYPDPAPDVIYKPAPTVIYQTPNTVYQPYTNNGANNTNTSSSSNNTNTQSTNTSNTTSTTSTTSKVTANDYKKVTANALFGSHSFMPSGLVQWVILAIFILLVIVLIRRAFGAEERYHSEPLKHA